MRLRTFSMAVAGLFAAPPLCLTAVPAAAQQPAADTSAPVVYNEPRVTITPDRSRPALIETPSGPVRGYQAYTSRSATKTDSPIEEIPQTIQVLPRAVIDDQRPIGQTELFANIPGVSPPAILVNGQTLTLMRGLPAERFIDGLPNYYDYGARDSLINVERVEALKGPSSILYQGGANPIGGVINVISKTPQSERFAETGITFGGPSLWSPFFDVNQPISDKVLFRMTGQYESTGATTEVITRRSYSFNPSVTLTNNEGTSLLLMAEVTERRQQDFSGLPITGTLNQAGYSVRRNLFVGNKNLPDVQSRRTSLTARFDHRFDEVWSTFTTARYSEGRWREPAQLTLGNAPAIPPSTFGLFNGFLNEDNTEFSFNSNLVAKFRTGSLSNKLLFGVDYNRVTDKGLFVADFAGPVDLNNPVFPRFTSPVESLLTTFTKVDNIYTQSGVTGQIQSSLWDRIHFLGALRLANVDIKSKELTNNSAFHTDKTQLLPRLGLAVDVARGFSPFVSWSQGLRAVPFFQGAGAPKPEGSEQIEAGVKLNFGFGLSGTLAAFEIKRTNVAITTLGVTQVQTGEQRSRGFDADLVWQPDANWAFSLAYAHVGASVTKDENAAIVGKQLVNAPRNSGRLWGNYKFTSGDLEGLSLGAGFYASSPRVVELGNGFTTPSFITFDAAATYSLDDWTFALTGKNLTDQRYYLPYQYLQGRVAPGEERAVYATISRRF